jgi:hypothetical protein
MACSTNGDVDASLLDVAPEIQQRIAAMPMLRWKCSHVKKNRDGR